MIILDLPPQIELQITHFAKQHNMTVQDYIMSNILNSMQKQTDDELYELTGIQPLTSGKNKVTDEMVQALRLEYHV